jgi:hypothetical protein
MVKNNITIDNPFKTVNNFFIFNKIVWRRCDYYHMIEFPNDYKKNNTVRTFVWK